jgi:uncharacterized repeat protein (TIGR03803 family)
MKKNYFLRNVKRISTIFSITCNLNNKHPNKFSRLYIIIIMALIATQSLMAQYKKLFEFEAEDNNNMRYPYLSQVVSYGSALFGMTSQGGSYNLGVIFKINNDGTGYQKFLDFDNTNGGDPYGSLTLVGDSLYGMTYQGGNNGNGVIFKINMNGSGFQRLYSFINSSGSFPYGSLTLVGDSLYGMTSSGGTNADGVIFKIHRNGSGFQKLLDLDGTITGESPYGSLTLVGDSLYGMSGFGGTNTYGVIFKIHRNGSGFQKLLDFDNTNSGRMPFGSLTLSGDSLYGMTIYGGSDDAGVLFKINKNGSGFKKIFNFDFTNGAYPLGSLTLTGDSLYGMTSYGGDYYEGIIFKISKSGNGFQKLLNFDGTGKGSDPYGTLTLSGSTLYGMTYQGGTSNNGVIFKIDKDGSGFSKLRDCTVLPEGSSPNDVVTDGTYLYGTTYSGCANNDGGVFKTNINGTGYQQMFEFNGNGANPKGSLTLVGDSLYGTTYNGGSYDYGAIFKINVNGSGYQKLYNFIWSEGANPQGSLTLVGDSLYGMVNYGGANNKGTIYKINRDGSGFQKLYDFDTNNGAYPYGSLTLVGDSLYGTTSEGGTNGYGIIFKINRNGSGFQKLLNFEAVNSGGYPKGSLTLSGDSLYGLTNYGGTNLIGVIFKINRNGSGFRKMHDFEWSEGVNPKGSLTLLGDELYGMASLGASYNYGSMFKINTKTGLFFKLLNFDNINSGGVPYGSLFLFNKTLYGTCPQGGADGIGVVFKYKPLASIQATNIQFTNVLATQMNISFTRGDGIYRAVFMYQGNSGTPTLTNGNTYTANNVFGSGSQAGAGWYCIAYGTLSSGTVTVTGLTANTGYRVMVIEYNGESGEEIYLTSAATGNPNNQSTIGVQNQTIAFTALPAKSYGNADFDPGATASSGLPVSYASSNPAVATIVSGMIHIVGIGTSTITASQAGNGNYNVATPVDQNLTVTKGNQTITFPALPVKDLGNADFNPGATASSGLTVNYTSSNTNVATIVGGLIHIVGVGTTNITASQAGNSNYNAASDVIRVLTVKSAQSVTFNSLPPKTYGDADFSAGATASSGLTVAYASSNTNIASVTGSTLHIVSAGTTEITASQAGNSEYNAATDVTQTLTVNKAPLIVTANNNARAVGQANPVLTFTYSGFVGSDTEDVIDVKPTAACTATILSPVGNYDITISGGSDNNYIFTYVTGVLTVESGTAISKSDENGLEIYPVPASNLLYVKIPGGGAALVQIMNMNGQVVITKKLTNETETFDVSKLAKGVYTLKIVINEKVFVRKVEIR